MTSALFFPIPFLTLQRIDSLDFGEGFSIERVPDSVKKEIQDDADTSQGYTTSLENLTHTLVYRPIEGRLYRSVISDEANILTLYVAFLIRLATGIPLSCPWWYYRTDKAHGYGRSFIFAYRYGSPHIYALDDVSFEDVVQAICANMSDLTYRLEKYINNPESGDRVVRALEIASFGFQTRHIPVRLVVMTTFLEILFSTDKLELSHKVSERIAWYLEPESPENRLSCFEAAKRLYGLRSHIVHGGSHWEKAEKVEKGYTELENLNTRIFKEILLRSDMKRFSASKKERATFFQELCLGV